MSATLTLPALPPAMQGALDPDNPPQYSIYVPGEITVLHLPLAEKVLLSLICGLHRQPKGCFASNKWFAERICATTRTVSSLLQTLVDKGYIRMESYVFPAMTGGHLRVIIPLDLHTGVDGGGGVEESSIPPGNPAQGMENSSTPPGNGFHTPEKILPDCRENSSTNSEVHKQEEKTGNARAHARGDCLPAVCSCKGDGDGGGLIVSGTARASPAPSPGAALLLLPVAEGGAGFDSLAAAETVAALRPVEELRDWIAECRPKARNLAGFIRARIEAGDPPPERHLRKIKQSFAMGKAPAAPVARDRENVAAYHAISNQYPDAPSYVPNGTYTREECRRFHLEDQARRLAEGHHGSYR